MYMWGHTVLQVSPYVKLSVYIDDRTLWCRRRQGVEDLRRAIQVTMQLDSALGFSFHSNKCEFSGCGVVRQRALHNVSEDLQLRWPVVGTFKLLGVHYNLLVETIFFLFPTNFSFWFCGGFLASNLLKFHVVLRSKRSV